MTWKKYGLAEDLQEENMIHILYLIFFLCFMITALNHIIMVVILSDIVL